ncbi:MAG TPA: Rid family detoxifying hydrolase [Bdellovibrionota bacterium]|nr:Rid family detoxifying hydrolase [Bdellovibrionota bacterium]
MDKKQIKTDKAPAAVGPYSQAIQTGNLLFISGQIPIDVSKNGEIFKGDIKIQTKIVMENIKALLESQKLTLKNIVKVSIFLTDMKDFASVNEVYGSYFKEDPPARACVAVSELPKGVNVEVEAVAVIN